MAPIVLYSDDMSGNRSKKWNKFDAWCLTLAGLQQKEAHKFQNIHFVSCSNRLSALQMADPLVEELKQLENGIKVFDALSQSYIFVIAPVICVLCDNVRASELLNHMGSKANKLCRFCMVSLCGFVQFKFLIFFSG